MIKIEQTTNYGKFKTIRGNRAINRTHLKKLSESILDNNMLEANPIIVDERFKVLDGQHRLLAAEKLGLPIYYVVVKFATGHISEVQMLNSNLRAWSMNDFLNSYVERGNEDYIKLKKFMENTGLSRGISVMLLEGAKGKNMHGRGGTKDFKEGLFKASFVDFAEDIAKKLTELEPYCEDGVVTDREFVSAIVLVYRAGITHEKLLEKLKASGKRVPWFNTRRQYIRLLEDILSYKSKTPIRLI